MSLTAQVDITQSFIQQLKKNGAHAKQKGDSYTTLFGLPAKLKWFKGMVQNNGPWDFKNSIYKSYKDSGVEICGVHYAYDMPGNFHYGFVGAAAQIADIILYEAAGYAQKKAGTSRPEYHCSAGDDPVDHEFIRLGIKLYDDHGLHFSQDQLKSVLKAFQPKTCLTFKPRRMPMGGYMREDGIIVKSPGEM